MASRQRCPLAVAALAALLIGLPGDRSQLDDGWLVAVACALAVVVTAAPRPGMPARAQIVLRALFGAVSPSSSSRATSCPTRDSSPGSSWPLWSPWRPRRCSAPPREPARPPAAALLGAGAAAGWAVAGLVPFVGYLLSSSRSCWRGARGGAATQKYAGLRVLR